MLNESLGYLQRSDEWVKTVLIGGLLTLLGGLVVPAILVLGYLVRVLRATMRGDEQPPEFDEWGDLFVDGAKAFVIAFVYGLIPVVLGGLLVGVGAASAMGGDSAGAVVGGIVVLVGSLVVLALSLLAAYVVPAATANYAREGSLGAGFDVGELRSTLVDGTYFTAWLTGFVIVVVASVVSGLLNVVPLLGVLVGGFLSFYAVVSAYYLVGNAWDELHADRLREEDRRSQQPAV